MKGYQVLESEINKRLADLGFLVYSSSFPADGVHGEVKFTIGMSTKRESLQITIPEHVKTLNLLKLNEEA